MKTALPFAIGLFWVAHVEQAFAQMAPCNQPAARTTLETNNIRASYLVGGPHFSNLQGGLGGFEVPKGSGKSAFSALSFWIGGIDAIGALKVAAQTYRQTTSLGIGYWAGPLTLDSATTSSGFCNLYDQAWRINAADVRNHRSNAGTPGYQVPASIANWPGNGEAAFGYDPNLAPYHDVNNNGIYDPAQGDYPKFLGDEALWMVYNDKGNAPSANKTPVGIEVQETIFAFNRPGPFQNAQFMEYKIINRSTLRLDSVFYGHFVDPALGNPIDDFIGCDVTRGMGFVYNADDDDEGPEGYGTQPPAAGFAVFRGPYSDFNDGIDNNLNGQIDEMRLGCDQQNRTESFTMWNFISFVNDASPMGNPTTADHAFNYLIGKWKDGQRMVFGGNGYPGSIGATILPTRYQFPGSSDPNGFGLGGTVTNPVSAPFDWTTPSGFPGPNVPGAGRRFVMSMGPGTMMPGAVNSYIVGALWARANSGGAQASLTALRNAKTQIQQAFDNCSLYGFNGLSASQEALDQLRLFPNPAGSKAWLEVPGQFTNELKVEVLDLQGKLLRKAWFSPTDGSKLAIDLEGLDEGLYLIRVSESGTSKTFKLLKQ
jgi:hypothetical protein